jgi:nicotinate-nucleotide adenylyltransferase
MNVAVYSGSFNPLHIGHLAIMKHLIHEAGYDMVYLIVSPMNPFKQGMQMVSGEERYKAAVEAVLRHKEELSVMNPETGEMELKVKVDDIELSMPAPHYTIKTLNSLKEREPHNNFKLVMGADNLASIRKWKSYVDIISKFGIIVFPRDDFDIESIKNELLQEGKAQNQIYIIDLMKFEKVDVSSSFIRSLKSEEKKSSIYLV